MGKVTLRVRQDDAQPRLIDVDIGEMNRDDALEQIAATILPDVRAKGGTVSLTERDGLVDVRPVWPEWHRLREALADLLARIEADRAVMDATTLVADDEDAMVEALRKGHLAGVHARNECVEGLAQFDRGLPEEALTQFTRHHLLRARRFWAERYEMAGKARGNANGSAYDRAEAIARRHLDNGLNKTAAAKQAVQQMFEEHGINLQFETIRTRLYREK